MHTRGNIFHHKDLVFKNGFTGNKYLILLNTPSKNEPCLFVKTTSQKKDKPEIAGCLERISLFFIPGGKSFFPLNTWVQLYELYRFNPGHVDQSRDINKVGELGPVLIDQIVKCLLQSQEQDLSKVEKNLLQPPIQDSLERLKNKFNKGK